MMISVLKVGSYMPSRDLALKAICESTPLLAKAFIKNSIKRIRI
jgi:hypothetical protein